MERSAQPVRSAASTRLQARDFATLGIFSALYLALTVIVGALTTNPMFLIPWAPAIIALVGGPIFMIMPAKVHKTGAIIIPSCVVGIIWALMGGIVVCAALVIAGAIGEVLVTKTGYKKFGAITAAYVLFCVGYHIGCISIAWIFTDYFTQISSYPAEMVILMEGVVNSPNGYLSLVGTVIAAIAGAYFGRAVLKKHFVAAGIVRN